MKDWLELALSFVFGVAIGVVFSFFLFESRIRFYRHFIEERLASINLLRHSKGKANEGQESSFWKSILGGRPKAGSGSKHSQNE
jgi:hypothetical protein